MQKLAELDALEIRQLIRDMRQKTSPRVRDYNFVDELEDEELQDLYQLFGDEGK